MSQRTEPHFSTDTPAVVPIQERLKFSDKGIAELDALQTHYPNLKACILRRFGSLSGSSVARCRPRPSRKSPTG